MNLPSSITTFRRNLLWVNQVLDSIVSHMAGFNTVCSGRKKQHTVSHTDCVSQAPELSTLWLDHVRRLFGYSSRHRYTDHMLIRSTRYLHSTNNRLTLLIVQHTTMDSQTSLGRLPDSEILPMSTTCTQIDQKIWFYLVDRPIVDHQKV